MIGRILVSVLAGAVGGLLASLLRSWWRGRRLGFRPSMVGFVSSGKAGGAVDGEMDFVSFDSEGFTIETGGKAYKVVDGKVPAGAPFKVADFTDDGAQE